LAAGGRPGDDRGNDEGHRVIELKTHDGVPSGGLRADWELLLDEDPSATIFQGPRFLSRWVEVLGKRTTARVHTVHRDGRLIGVIPEGHEREGTPTGPIEVRRFLGGTEVTDYLGPIARPEDRVDVADAYMRELANDANWDELVAGGLAADTDWAGALLRSSKDHGLVVFEHDVEDVCPRVDLHGGYDGYLSRLPGKYRHELGRKARKLARDAGEIEVVRIPGDEVADRLDAFLDMAGETEPDKAGFFAKNDVRAWFKALADEFVGDDIFRLHQLDVGGIPAAATVSLVQGREWGLYNSAFDSTLRQLAPGMVLVGELIKIAAQEGCEVFDLLRGDEPYKYRFGAQDRPVERVTIVRR
jgi:CelD/BcsL family acetyltransferase involved in cellulose biosynthesis